MPIKQLLQGLKQFGLWLKNHALLVASLAAALFYALYKRERNVAVEATAKQIAAEKRGEVNELQKETKEAEKQAKDSRADYERIAAKHRVVDSDYDGQPD